MEKCWIHIRAAAQIDSIVGRVYKDKIFYGYIIAVAQPDASIIGYSDEFMVRDVTIRSFRRDGKRTGRKAVTTVYSK